MVVWDFFHQPYGTLRVCQHQLTILHLQVWGGEDKDDDEKKDDKEKKADETNRWGESAMTVVMICAIGSKLPIFPYRG